MSNAPQTEAPHRWTATAVRFACGAALGLVVSIPGLFAFDPKIWACATAGIALVCGLLTAKFGYEFWDRVRNWWG